MKSKSPIIRRLMTLFIFAGSVFLVLLFASHHTFPRGPPTPPPPARTLSTTAVTIIPKKIWTFWHRSVLPDFFQRCIDSWKYWNADYQIVVLSPQTIREYDDDGIFSQAPFKDDVRLLSDIVRLRVLSKHGGIWMDTSIICNNQNLDWFREKTAQGAAAEYVGYFAKRFTSAEEHLTHSPIIESWMFGCIPNSPMVNAWLHEFERIRHFSSIQGYVRELQTKHGVSVQNIPNNSVVYLVVYLSLQRVLQQHPPGKFRFHVIPSDDTAMAYLQNNGWQREKAVLDLLENASTYCREQNILKICKEERSFLLQKGYRVLFSRRRR